MASTADLIRWRDGLIQARLSGIREITDQNGETVRYGSDRELALAIAAAERMIASGGTASPSIVRFKTSKGI